MSYIKQPLVQVPSIKILILITLTSIQQGHLYKHPTIFLDHRWRQVDCIAKLIANYFYVICMYYTVLASVLSKAI